MSFAGTMRGVEILLGWRILSINHLHRFAEQFGLILIRREGGVMNILWRHRTLCWPLFCEVFSPFGKLHLEYRERRRPTICLPYSGDTRDQASEHIFVISNLLPTVCLVVIVQKYALDEQGRRNAAQHTI